MVLPPHPHPEVDQWLEEADQVLDETNPAPDPQPEQTDNRPRPEDGDQDVDQKILAPQGSPGP